MPLVSSHLSPVLCIGLSVEFSPILQRELVKEEVKAHCGNYI